MKGCMRSYCQDVDHCIQPIGCGLYVHVPQGKPEPSSLGHDVNSLVHAARELISAWDNYEEGDAAKMDAAVEQLRKATPTESVYPLTPVLIRGGPDIGSGRMVDQASPYAGRIHENVMPETATGANLNKVAAISAIPALIRIRTLCEPCKGSGAIVMRASIWRCGACGGWGYTDESDHDFRIRMMEAVKACSEVSTDTISFTLLMPDEVPAVPCEHDEYLTCINCDTAHSTPEGSA